MGKIQSRLMNRIYFDYFMPCRLGELEAICKAAIDGGYEMHSVISFWDEISKGLSDNKKYFISRHDVDTDVTTARRMFEIESRLSMKASYYFRLSTLNVRLMQEIDASGSEASYHFEEISTLAKKHNWSRGDIDYKLAADVFYDNYREIKESSRLPMRSVCSHGDFANRRLGVPNHKLLTKRLRLDLGIDVETYDDEFMSLVTSRHSDTLGPPFYVPHSPLKAILESRRVIYFLTHPRSWRVNWWDSTKENVIRAWEGAWFKGQAQ